MEGTPLGVGNRIIKNDAQKGAIKEIFGPKGSKLTEVINNEARFRSTSNKMKNSVTARDTADAKEGLAGVAAEAASGNAIMSFVRGFFSYLTGGLDEAGRSAAVDGLLKQIDKMSDDSTWDDLINEIYVRQVIDRGLADSKAGRTLDVSDVRKKYGLPE